MTPDPLIRPWEGEHYQSNPLGQRLFLLGESMYNEEGVVPPDVIREVIGWQSQGLGHVSRFYDRVYHTVTGKRKGQSCSGEYQAFWNRVSFYNYIQYPLRGRARDRVRPTDAMWSGSKAFFPGVFTPLWPDFAIVFGKQLWWQLTQAGFVSLDESGRELLGTDSIKCPVVSVPHPASYGYSARRWHTERVAQFLAPQLH